MRLFLAADLDEGPRAAVSEAVTRFRARAERVRPGYTRGVAWVDASNLHLTLHFIGELDEAALPLLTQALAPALELSAPRLALAGWGSFPARGPARVIWVGVTEGAEALSAAHAALGERLTSAGVAIESRPFSPHLTVGRVKVPSGSQWQRLAEGIPADPIASWELRSCTLFQSLLSPSGPTYRALLSVPFAVASGRLAAGR